MSREIFKVSGKKLEWPEGPKRTDSNGGWSFTVRPGGWILAEGSRSDGSIERRRFALHEFRGKLAVSIGGAHWHGEIAPVARGGSAQAAGSDADLTAQFPGKVRKRVVAEGAVVAEGEPLVLVEAMKMEFAVKAPFAGTVRKFLVVEGQQLSPGDRILELDPTQGSQKE